MISKKIRDIVVSKSEIAVEKFVGMKEMKRRYKMEEICEGTLRGGVQIENYRVKNGAFWHSASECFRTREMRWDGNS